MTRILKSTENSTSVAAAATITAAAPPPEAVALESDFVVILASLLCALICTVALIAVCRCTWFRRGGSGAGGGAPGQSLANKGLKKKVLQSMPKFTYIDSNSEKWLAASECAICLAEFVGADEIRVLPQCGHGFHAACIDTWLGSHSSCPSCRQILVLPPRCRRCGLYPAVRGGEATGTSGSEPELKSRHDDNATTANNDYANSSTSHHQRPRDNVGFLP
ncbi:RING-H2 finger protein ATL80-like [Neltuma alba]|uniref:RING-H2 finger protein ATL80-like n=1 Tax=Neltuma alba TaxID=207710 RepID=UPI0010A3850A|nr:RING-H2 finger protein ATL80-like [Prosopis alba]XP_028796921.1 RING-H2 finger protein ATL80-like [Prosopis alba]XP_028797068.1 RING-H2 finger protein ATL80-like [Prosopis alba]